MKQIQGSSKIRAVITIVLCSSVVVGGVVYHVKTVEKLKNSYIQINQEVVDRISAATRTTYSALADIERGQIVTEDMLVVNYDSLCEEAPSLLMTAADIGKKATVDISAGEIITSSMITEALDKDWQEVEVNCIWLSTNLKQYDCVDVRILFPNGTDYIVLPKKELRRLKLSKNNLFLWLTEDEILRLNSAIVDANLHNAKIYTTKYVKPTIEEANITTYQPTTQIIDLLNSDPNVLIEAKQNLSKAARANIEQKMSEFKTDYTELEDENSDMGWDFQLDTTTEGSGLQGNSGNNNGYTSDEEDALLDSEAAIESSRNMEGYDGGDINAE